MATGKAPRTRERSVDALADKLLRAQAKIDQAHARIDEAHAKVQRAAPRVEKLAEKLDALEVWLRQEPGSRKPRWSRDEIAGAAVRIADAEGIDAISMRRLAVEVGAGTMTLYHYVRTKDELMALLMDEVLAEVVCPDPMPPSWRSALVEIATRSRDALLRHPWVFDISDDPAIGPNSVRHFDQSLQALSSLDIDLRTKLDIMTAVDEYVFGYCLHQRNDRDVSHADADTVIGYVRSLVDAGGYPALAALLESHGAEHVWHEVQRHGNDHERFTRNLGRLLDGISADLGLTDDGHGR